jgi:hypothetical protein
LLVDLPGIDGANGKPSEMIKYFETVLGDKAMPLTGVLLCVETGKRLTMGDNVCQQLLNMCLEAEMPRDQGCGERMSKWDNVIVVGTKRDQFKAHLAEDKLREARGKWKNGLLTASNERLGADFSKCVFTNVCPEEGMKEADVVELIREIELLAAGSFLYRRVSSKALADMLNAAYGEVIITEHDIEHYRSQPKFSILMGGAKAVAGGAVLAAGIGSLGITSTLLTAAYCMGGAATLSAGGEVLVVVGTALTVGYASHRGIKYMDDGIEAACAKVKEEEHDPLLKIKIFVPDLNDEIAAFLSAQIYDCSGNFENASKKLGAILSENATFFDKQNKRIVYHSVKHGEIEDPHSPIAMVICESNGGNATMFIAWRGTDRLIDFLTDSDVFPTAGMLWDDYCCEIKSHNGMYGRMQDLFMELIERVQVLCSQHSVENVVFTGHSLGGGLAQIALLAANGQKHAKFKEVKNEQLRKSCIDTFNKVKFTAVAFAAPMVFYFPKQMSDTTRMVWQSLQLAIKNFVYENDVVPRFPRLTTFLEKIVPVLVREESSVWFQDKLQGTGHSWIPTSVVSSYCGKKLETMTQPAVAKILEKLKSSHDGKGYQHACTIYLCSKEADVKEPRKEKRWLATQMNPKEFELISLKNAENFKEDNNVGLIRLHSVCPQCVGHMQHKAVDQRVESTISFMAQGGCTSSVNAGNSSSVED